MSEPTLTEIVRESQDSRLLDVWTAAVCRVEKYVAGSPPTVDALPMVRRAITDTDGNTQHEELPVLPNVPVLFPGAVSFSMSWPLAPGDFVLVIFCSSAIGNWRETGDVADPGDLRRHDLSHGIAIAGILPKGGVLPTDPVAALIEVVAHLQVGAGAAQFVALSNLVTLRLTEMVTAINAATIALGAGGAADVGVKLTAAGWTAMPVPPTMAATKLKSE